MYDGSIALDAASVTLEPSVPPLCPLRIRRAQTHKVLRGMISITYMS